MGPSSGLLWEAVAGCAAIQPGALLAQSGFGLIDPPAPRALPSPPPIEHYLLENPWPLVVVLAVAGVTAFLRLRAAGKPRPGTLWGLTLFLAAGGVWTLASWVQTGREAITRSTAALIGAAARADIPSLDALLSDQLSLFRPGGGPGLGKTETIGRVQRDLGGPYRVREWAVLETQAMTDSASSGVAQVRVRVTLEAAGIPNISWWRIDWRKGADGAWRAVTIEPVSVTVEVRERMR